LKCKEFEIHFEGLGSYEEKDSNHEIAIKKREKQDDKAFKPGYRHVLFC
jgi:hypothetical protein